jgi:hypothetical protein
MSLRLLTKMLTLTHREQTTVGSDGRPVTDETVVQTKGGFKRASTSSSNDAGLVIVDEWTVYLSPSVDVAPGDVIEVDGGIYEVISEPLGAWNHRTGKVHHLEARVRRAER